MKEVRKGYGMVDGGGCAMVVNAVLVKKMYWDEKVEQVEDVDVDAVSKDEVVVGGPMSKFFAYVDVSTGEGKDYTLA